MATIPVQDRAFFDRVLSESVEVGYIQPPSGWRGRTMEPRLLARDPGGCWICCVPCIGGGRGSDELAVVIGTVFFVFSSIIAFAYAARSTQSACRANYDHTTARYKIEGSSPHVELYRDAAILLEGRRKERTWVALAQGAMCVGAALLTVAILVSCIAEGEILFFECGFAGIGMLAIGAAIYGGTRCFFLNIREQEAAQRLVNKLSS